MGQSKSHRRRQQRKKKTKKKADAVASADSVASSESRLSIKTCFEPRPPIKPFFSACRASYVDRIEYWKEKRLFLSSVTKLVPRFPERRETLSLDDGFAQTPNLKSISSLYDFEPSQAHMDMEISNFRCRSICSGRFSINNTNLGVVYSEIAPSVVAVSSFYGVERKWECSGLVIHWSSTENEATILTSTSLLWDSHSKFSNFEFHLVVRMADGTLLLGKEDYVDYYHGLLTLKVKSMVELEAVDLRSRQATIVDEMHVISLGRSFYTHSLYDFHGNLYPRRSPEFGCGELLWSSCHNVPMCEGGPLVTDTGCVIGINFLGEYISHTLPTPIILSCLEMWTSFRTVLWPWFGMSVIDVNQLSNFEREFSISTRKPYVVVKKVYGGSLAEKSKVRKYDSVATLNGTLIESAKQYYQLLSEASRAATCCDSAQRLMVVIHPYGVGTITIEADYIPVDDKRFCKCWPQVENDAWLDGLLGSRYNPSCGDDISCICNYGVGAVKG